MDHHRQMLTELRKSRIRPLIDLLQAEQDEILALSEHLNESQQKQITAYYTKVLAPSLECVQSVKHATPDECIENVKRLRATDSLNLNQYTPVHFDKTNLQLIEKEIDTYIHSTWDKTGGKRASKRRRRHSRRARSKRRR